MSVILVLLGVGLLYFGGELLVKNASLLARSLGLSPLVVGLTVVAFGTSAPELAASLVAALVGNPELAFGNVVGSNIANLGLILGGAALLSPIRAQARFLRRELPFMVLVALLMVGAAWDGRVSRLEGAFFLVLMVAYLVVLMREPESSEVLAEYEAEFGSKPGFVGRRLLFVLLGTAFLALGAAALVEGASTIARALGVPERVIGLSVVAVGTSLPELAAALVAALKREGDILLGNVIGSNVFNVLGILGSVALARPLSVTPGPTVDLELMVGFSLVAWAFLWTGLRLGRKEGVALLLFYGFYLVAIF